MNFEKKPPGALDMINQKLLSQTPLHYACYSGDKELLEKLLSDARAYNNNNGDAALSCLMNLISEEDCVNGWTPAHWAAMYGQVCCLCKIFIR